ncbi:MAG: hypothetical protein ACT4OM_00445 [Actinomycetota bacterium]
MALKRPKLSKREPQVAAPSYAPPPVAAQPINVPSPNVEATSSTISVKDLNMALGIGGSASALSSAGLSGSGISTESLGMALTGGGLAGGNHSMESTRHTSYPQMGDLNGLPAKAGTRRGPRTTSYRIPLQRSAHSNIYDSVN